MSPFISSKRGANAGAGSAASDFEPVSMIVEDAVMAPLDAVASELGYTSTGDGGRSSN